MADEGLVQLLQLLGSPDKGARQQAEAHYSQLKESSMPQVGEEGRQCPRVHSRSIDPNYQLAAAAPSIDQSPFPTY